MAGLNAVVGGAYPNHWLVFESDSTDGLNELLKQCKDGEKGDLAQEVKVAVISFQDTPPGFAPYLIATALPQTLNENNSFKEDVMSVCIEAAAEVGNAVVLNDSTDGVSCEVQDNFQQQCKYLTGQSNYLSFPDPNHNAKNGRQQMLTGGGRTPSIIGRFCFDAWMLKQCGTAKDLVRVVDFASDALVLKLASSKVVTDILSIDTADTGNQMASDV